MGKNLVTEAERYLNSRHKDKRRSQVLRIVGVLVVFVTIYALILPAVTMSNEVECGQVEHIHTESCWQEQLTGPEPELVCQAQLSGVALIHTHDSLCYNDRGELICTLPELEAHVHGPECYQEQRTLLCDQVADPGHQHSAACYSYVRVETAAAESVSGYTCGFQEGEGAHRHTEECYPEEWAEQPICGLEETGDEYDEEGNLVRQGHTHTDECWLVRVHEKLICGQEETEDEYDEEGNLILAGHRHTSACWLTGDELCYQYGCGQQQSEGHVHTAACGQGGVQTDSQGELWEQVLICQEEEREPGHVHTDECYDIEQVLTCHKQELQPHVHDAGCYDENGILTCGKAELLAHQHTSECFVTPEGEPELTRTLVCGMEEHTHTEQCYVKLEPKEEQTYYCGMNEHVHTLSDCYFETGALRCTLIEHVHDLSCLVPPAEETDEPDPDGSEEPAQPAEETVELTDAVFEYATDAFTMTFHVNGLARVAEEQTEQPSQPVQTPWSGEESTADPTSWVSVGPVSDPASWVSTGPVSDPTPWVNTEPAGDPEPSPSGEILVDITNQMVPLAALPRSMSFMAAVDDVLYTVEPSAIDEFSGTTEPGSVSEPPETAVENSSQPLLDDQELATSESVGLQPSAEPTQTLAGQVEFQAVKVPEDSEEYKSFAAYAEQLNGGNKPEAFELVTLTASIGGMELDLSNCYMTVEVTVDENALEGGSAPAALSLEEDGIDAGAESEETGEEELGVALLTSETVDEASGELNVNVVDSVPVRMGSRSVMRAMMKANAPVATSSTNSATNPPYTVQYYAYLERFDYDETGAATTLSVINTDKGADPVTGEGKGAGVGGSALPKNGDKESNLNILKVPLVTEEGVTIKDNETIGVKAEIKTKTELTQIFKDKGRVFDPSQEFATADKKLDTSFLNGVKSGTETGTNATYEDHYNLEEVWFREDGKTTWTVYTTYEGDWDPDRKKNVSEAGDFEVKRIEVKNGQTAEQALNEALVYTNTARTQVEEGQHKVVIRSDSEIRLVYTQKKATDTKKAMLFDYDITDGTKNEKGAYITTENGINAGLSDENYASLYEKQGEKEAVADPVYAFGNANAGVKFGYNTNGGYYLNKANSGTYGDCSFELVNGINLETIEPIFAPNIRANPIFSSEEGIQGKTNYSGCDMTFNRLGDTFTLSSINGGSNGVKVEDLENFKLVYNQLNWKQENKKIWSNSFWPMDNVPAENRKDPLFGAAGNTPSITKSKYSGDNTFPASDDKENHNSYFGMKFQVEFSVPQDYVGPLEYMFYGDDDMWVFLDDKLVCDIGGVHSSVGEYVNLWDYITDGPGSDGKHTLSVFYTERGASGSSCWMQFTLPNMMETQPDYSGPSNQALRIEKEVVGEAVPNLETQEYTFSLTLTNTTQTHSGKIFSSGGEPVTDEWIEFQPNEETRFNLKHGQYLLIESLAGAQYLVKEVSQPDGCVTTVNGSATKDKDGCVYLTGQVMGTGTTVHFTNTFTYRLPETGGAGAWYTMAGAPLAAAFCLWYKKKNRGEGAADEA